MAIIDPDGLFSGDRLRKCSDLARLYWPFLFLAGNGYGRLEINYNLLIGRVFASFKKPPTEEQIYAVIQEYRDNHLMFLYECKGQIWGQWWCKPGSLKRWPTKKDKESPDPPQVEYDLWVSGYSVESKPLPKTFENLPKTSEIRGKLLHGLGVGLGVGEEKATPPSPDGDLADWEIELPIIASRIHARHPMARRCSVTTVTAKVTTIAKKTPTTQRLTRLRYIDSQHAKWCESGDWLKDDCAFAKSLEAWLNPKTALWENNPIRPASTSGEVYREYAGPDPSVKPPDVAELWDDDFIPRSDLEKLN